MCYAHVKARIGTADLLQMELVFYSIYKNMQM